jgi:uncharacterized membrane-anchored protein YhcB (DUF1043 family)
LSNLDEKKAEIDSLLDEFSWHSSRVAEIVDEVTRLMKSLQKDHGAAALPIFLDYNARLQRIASKAERRPSELKA